MSIDCPNCRCVLYHSPAATRGLTRRQHAILDIVVAHLINHHEPPTYSQIGDAAGITKSGAYEHVIALIERGWLRRLIGRRQTLTLTEPTLALYRMKEDAHAH